MLRRLTLLGATVAMLMAAFGGAMATVEVLASPTTKEQCKKGGWKDLGFKNQGQCIKAVVVEPPPPVDTTAPETTVDSLDTSSVATDGSVVAHFS